KLLLGNSVAAADHGAVRVVGPADVASVGVPPGRGRVAPTGLRDGLLGGAAVHRRATVGAEQQSGEDKAPAPAMRRLVLALRFQAALYERERVPVDQRLVDVLGDDPLGSGISPGPLLTPALPCTQFSTHDLEVFSFVAPVPGHVSAVGHAGENLVYR